MITISLCMIVKNEEATLRRCLNSIYTVVDEIIIVDTGSIDRTKQIASQYTQFIYDYKWNEDFSSARNEAFSHATMDYIIWLDADDMLLPEDAVKLEELKRTLDPEIDIIMMKYHTGFDEFGKTTFSYYRERMIRRERQFKWIEPVHEYIECAGKSVNTDIRVVHAKLNRKDCNDRNLKIYETLLEGGGTLSSRGDFYFARELMEHQQYDKARTRFEKFLNDNNGWIEDQIVACHQLGDCYLQLGDEGAALKAYLKALSYGVPRAETYCKIGYLYKGQKDYNVAIYWFEYIFRLDKPTESWGFIQEDYWGYIPAIECAVCYDAIGDLEKAKEYHRISAQYKPNDTAVLLNEKYFKEKIEELS